MTAAESRALSAATSCERTTRVRVIAVVLFLLTLALFAPACGNGFVNYDDPDYVTANPHVLSGLTWSGVTWALTAQHASNWHPLTWWSHMADVSLFGKSAAGHHATSVLLHALTTTIAFLAWRRLTGAVWTSALAAALFAWHPLRVESVAWVAERKDVLSGLFFFLCLWAYGGYVNRRRSGQPAVGWYLGALVAAGLGLLAKPMLVTLPCVLLLLDGWPLGRIGALRAENRPPAAARSSSLRWIILEKVPFFALVVGSAVVTFLAQKHGGAMTTALPLGARFANAVVSVVRYLGMTVWPANLAVLYPHPGHWDAAIAAAAVIVVATVSLVVVRQWRRRPWLLVGWLWFLGMLVPVSGIVQVGLQAMADRYTYLPVFGVTMAVLWTARELLAAAPRRELAAGLAFAALATMTVAQIRVWRSSLTLFTHTIAVAGQGNYVAYDNRGIAWGDLGQTDRAVADYEQSLAIRPDYPNANNNLARVLADQGRLADAVAHYQTALAVDPTMLEVHNNLANALSDLGRLDEAMEHYRYVLEREPGHLNALNGSAVVLASQGHLAEAEQQFRHVLALDPSNASAISNLGNVCALLGRPAEARQFFQRSLEQHPDDPRTLYNLGNVLVQTGELADAIIRYERAVQLAPVNPDAQAALGLALLRSGRAAEAAARLQIALQQRPDFPQAKAWLQAAEQADQKKR